MLEAGAFVGEHGRDGFQRLLLALGIEAAMTGVFPRKPEKSKLFEESAITFGRFLPVGHSLRVQAQMFPFPSKSDPRPSFEDIFFEQYSRLFDWALQLTGRDRPEAEDLVQELYVRFAHVGKVPEHIENAESYLFTVLRNLHYARARRARTTALDDLTIVDYDSVERGLKAVDRNGILLVRSELNRVCDYLCERKNSSRSASIFILRYYLGYFPNEVMKVAQATRVAVDKAVQAARREARSALERPGVLRQIGSTPEPKTKTSVGVDDPHGLFLSLRERIFKSCSGSCFGFDQLRSKYEQPGHDFTTEELAHLVSCTICLDQANQILGIPLLDERSPDDTIGRDTPQGPSSSSGPSPTLLPSRFRRKKSDSEQRRKQMKRCAQEANQHRPHRLLIAVDGDIRASQRVTAQLSELQVELGRTEKPSFIEVLSEQGICLAFVLVQAPNADGDLYQSQNTGLSDDRTMSVAVSFTTETPTIQVVYRDPLVAAEEQELLKEGPDAGLRPTTKPIALPALPSFGNSAVAGWPERFWQHAVSLLPSNMNPLLTSALLLGLCSIVCFLLWTRSGPRISPQTLLTRAEQSDAAASKPRSPGVVYQKVKISGSGHAMERAIYRDPENKRIPKRQHLSSDDQWLKDRLNIAGVNWDEPLSAANYGEWHDNQPARQDVVTRTGENLLTLTTSTGTNGPVLKESLTVRVSDFHPVGRTIELRDMGSVEIAELNYDVMPWGAVNQDWFEPLPGTVSDARPLLSVPIPHVLSDLELDSAELGARLALNQLHADTGEQIHVTRSASGVQVKGVVDTDQRKSQLVGRLQLMPHVHPSILSVEEIGSQPQGIPSRVGQPIQAYSVEAQASPLEQFLREKKLPTDNLAAISQSMLDNCLKVQQARGHLSELQYRFREANQLPGDLQNQLTQLSQSYVSAIQAGLDADKRTLLSLGFDTTVQPVPPSSGPVDDDLDQQVRHYQNLCQELIASGAGQSRSAQAIANDLITVGAQIRTHVPPKPASASTAHN
jgi:DNA-directed RNA polymerase specialized sigma24 family protein